MPSIRDMFTELAQLQTQLLDPASKPEDVQRMGMLTASLLTMSLQTITRYDYWRSMYAEKSGMSESDFDTMTDECIRHGASTGDECLHLVVTAGGYCANCGVNCRNR